MTDGVVGKRLKNRITPDDIDSLKRRCKRVQAERLCEYAEIEVAADWLLRLLDALEDCREVVITAAWLNEDAAEVERRYFA